MAPPPRHLLVVDDEPHVGLLLRPLLEQSGFRLTTARTLMAARAALADTTAPLDGMLLDLHLPDGSGLDLLAELRDNAATRKLPVMVVTAEGEDHILREVTALGALLLTKPFSPTKLTRRLVDLFGGGA